MGYLVECDRSALVGGFVGQTAIKTTEVIKKAMGGVLFIDEACTLVKEKEDCGHEAIDTLLKHVEDSRFAFAVVAAEYRDEMQRFAKSNPGLESRFTDFIHFPDYSAQNRARTFQMLADADQIILAPDLKTKLVAHYVFKGDIPHHWLRRVTLSRCFPLMKHSLKTWRPCCWHGRDVRAVESLY